MKRQNKIMNKIVRKIFRLLFFITFFATSQNTKPKSYIVDKEDYYTIDVKNNKPSVVLFSEEKKWVGDKTDNYVKGNKINFTSSFEEISDIEAYSLSPEKKKEKVKNIFTQDLEVENVFYHDMKFKYYYFNDLKDGSETYSSYKKQFKAPQFLDNFYFKDMLECKKSKLTLKVAKDIEIGYVLQGSGIEKIVFSSKEEGDYVIYNWESSDNEKEENFEDAPNISYYSPHIIFFIKSYKNTTGIQNVLGSVDNLYKFYCQTIKDINLADETAVKEQTMQLINGVATDLEKTKIIFDYVQTKINYVAFEDGMGGYIPREAADVFQKKYGDCKDMANLLNEMLKFAGIDSHIAWIGTRHNNYTYEKVPTPIVDNHMIAVAKINNEYVFLDATGQYTLFPSSTSFIQGKQALLKINENDYKIIPVPIIPAEKNSTKGKIQFTFENNKLYGTADFNLSGFVKTQFIGSYKATVEKNEMLRDYLARFIQNINTTDIEVKNEDLSQNPLEIKYKFELEKWVKQQDNQLIFKPILFFPYSNSRIDIDKRKVPILFDFKKAYDFEYEFIIPENYNLQFKPENFNYTSDLVQASINYTLLGNRLIITQKMCTNALLLEKNNFEQWNTAIKTITKQYNQNIIFSKK